VDLDLSTYMYFERGWNSMRPFRMARIAACQQSEGVFREARREKRRWLLVKKRREAV